MKIMSFNTTPKFIYFNNKIILDSNNDISTLNLNNKDGKLLYHLRYSSFIGYYKYNKLYYNHYIKNKNVRLLFNDKKIIISKIFATAKVPNLNRWNSIKYQIRKHL